ncbi:E3 ubiquitin-protein ligase MYLIP [Hydra vulgaris]|uniref:E3 ubiquitin-protein ligase MYLIP n=1 Tax=Hydra vulgaris TaxID=6087 RepID=UPI000192674E|nr:E3 ubiquitin-protein ligase MYLIP [Hydra vulgaris]
MMWCFVSEPSGTIHELILPKGSRGIDCLEKIASRINLVEKDYFGLRYINPSNGVESWLNLRNRLLDQLYTGGGPHRIQLMVKYFVNVQELQQPITRDLYYSTLVNHINHGKIDLKSIDKNIVAQIFALTAQVHVGDFNAEALPDYSVLYHLDEEWSLDFQKVVETEHLKLDSVTPSQAKIKFIQLVSELDLYGVESFHVHSMGDNPKELTLSVRHDGLRVYRANSCKEKNTETANLLKFITYDSISTVSYKGKRFTIVHGNGNTDHTHSSFLLKRNSAAISLFRTFTEYHSFFQCNTVKSSVIEKCSRNSFGRVFSVFFPNSNKGKLFLFDVMCTRRQAYNQAWSVLHAPNKNRQSAFYHSDRSFNRKSVYSLSLADEIPANSSAKEQKNQESFFFINNEDKLNRKEQWKSTVSHSNDINSLSLEELRDTVTDLIEKRMCQVCMDEEVSTAFCPCGHVVCCTECAAVCRECPLCRTQVTYAQRVFFN